MIGLNKRGNAIIMLIVFYFVFLLFVINIYMIKYEIFLNEIRNLIDNCVYNVILDYDINDLSLNKYNLDYNSAKERINILLIKNLNKKLFEIDEIYVEDVSLVDNNKNILVKGYLKIKNKKYNFSEKIKMQLMNI